MKMQISRSREQNVHFYYYKYILKPRVMKLEVSSQMCCFLKVLFDPEGTLGFTAADIAMKSEIVRFRNCRN